MKREPTHVMCFGSKIRLKKSEKPKAAAEEE